MKKLRLGFAMMMARAHVFIAFEILIVAYALPEYTLIAIDCVVNKSLNKKKETFFIGNIIIPFCHKKENICQCKINSVRDFVILILKYF